MRSQNIVLIEKMSLTLILLIWLICKWLDLTMEFIAFGAVIVALFKEDIYSFYMPPILTISVPESLDCGDEVDGKYMNSYGNVYSEKQTYLLIIVENIGIGIAKNIEVYLSGLESNVISNFARYKYIPLVTSWTSEKSIRSLPKNVGMRFSVCFLREDRPEEFNFISSNLPNALTKVKCNPGIKSHIKFEIIELSDNTKSVKREITIEFMGEYINEFKIYS